MKHARIIDGIVQECTETNPFMLFQPEYAAQFVEVADEVQSGWVRGEDGVLKAPAVAAPPTPPSVCSPRQLRQALTQTGLRDAVETAVAAGSRDLQDWWEFSTVFEEVHPEVTAMAAALNQSPEQVSALFALARSL
jgi:hypothetical protein